MSGPSLLSHLDAPIVVGDPDGLAAYVNPAFESVFAVESDAVTGEPLANLFEGGTREAVLRAVAGACDQGENVRFRIRMGEAGFSAVASPIVAEDSRVGVVILMVEASASDERFLALYREVADPLDELVKALHDILSQIRGGRAKQIRRVIDDGIQAIARLRRWSEDKYGSLSGAARPASGAEDSCFDAGDVVREVSEEIGGEFVARQVTLGVQVPAGLPLVAGEGVCLHQALMLLLQQRLETAAKGSTVELAARRAGADGVLISIADGGPDDGATGSGVAEPELVLELIRDLGGTLRTSSDSIVGRTTTIQLGAA